LDGAEGRRNSKRSGNLALLAPVRHADQGLHVNKDKGCRGGPTRRGQNRETREVPSACLTAAERRICAGTRWIDWF